MFHYPPSLKMFRTVASVDITGTQCKSMNNYSLGIGNLPSGIGEVQFVVMII